MISQKCPRCSSKRIRLGYRHTTFLSKLICRYNLLCDNCNWTFAGFAVPGTVGSNAKRSSSKNSKKSDNGYEQDTDSASKRVKGKAATT